MLKKENHFDFRKRLSVLHPPRRDSSAAPCGSDETEITSGWQIIADSEVSPLLHAAADLSDYFAKSMNVPVSVAEPGSAPGKNCIRICVSPESNELTSRITVTADGIVISGATVREAVQGCCRLEDELNYRKAPCAKRGSRTYTRMFSPRMTHSGWELEQFPDEYLPHIVHAGMDAILIFIREPPDMTRNGRLDMNEVVKKAAEYGLDVYVYPHVHTQASECHPLDANAPEFFENLYGSIVKNAPGIRGMVFVGESVAFPSRNPEIAGYCWNHVKGAKYLNGFWPTCEWADWLRLVRDTTRKYKPDLDLLFWTYNWFWAPEEDRLKLIQCIPDDITLHVTFEMGDNAVEKCGVPTWVDDYSISTDGPGTVFVSEARVAKERGIRLSSMTNTGGMTWDIGVVPFMPVPYRWMERCRAIRKAHDDWGLVSLMDSHHYGFTPGFIGELVKEFFTLENREEDFECIIRKIAARDFGEENADAVTAAWRDWSNAFYYHSARDFDQWGPLRVGPVFPFTLPGVPIPDPLHPQYEFNNGIQCGNGWKYIHNSFNMPEKQIDGYLEMAERELGFLISGCEKLRAVLPNVPELYRDEAERLQGIGDFITHSIRTMRNVKQFYRTGLKLQKTEPHSHECGLIVDDLLVILADEERNVRETIPLVEVDSRLGWEPTMGYTTDRENLEWKLRQLESERQELYKLQRGGTEQ